MLGATDLAPVVEFIELVVPELGFGLAEPAKQPLGIDEDIDEGAFGGEAGLVFEEVLVGESGEGDGVLTADDLRLGVDAGFQGILGRRGLALDGAWASGFLSIEAVGLG